MSQRRLCQCKGLQGFKLRGNQRRGRYRDLWMEGQTDNGMVRDNEGMENWGESHYFLSFIDEKKEHESQKQNK